jgi:hypothetical protein
MAFFPCPHLNTSVELSEDRERHICSHHPDLLPQHRKRIIEAIGDPDQIRRSSRDGNAKLFTKWFSDLRGGKYVVAVVICNSGHLKKPWMITAYMARKLAEGEIEWEKS